MGIVLHGQPWGRQPQYPVGPNKGISLGRRLVRLISFAEATPRDLVTGLQLTVVSTGFSRTATSLRGNAAIGQSNTNETSYWTLPLSTEQIQSMSIGWVGSMASGTATIAMRDATGSGGTIVIWRNSGWDLRLGGTDFTAGGTFNFSTNYAMCMTSSATASKVFVDGANVVSGAGGASALVSPWYVHQNGTGAQGCIATSLMLAIWDRPLADAEALSFTVNPWQLFAAPSRRLWMPDPSAVADDLMPQCCC